MLRTFIKRFVPSRIYLPILHHFRQQQQPVYWGNMRRISPISSRFGTDRGQPIDRYYIESFLEKHHTDIRGKVLEIGDPRYTSKYGGDRVTCSDVLHPVPDNPQATLIGDLQTGQGLASDTYDCMILTQTLLFIYDVQAAILHSYRTLSPGGVLLATFPGISQIVRSDMKKWGDYWRFTDASARRLFGDVFQPENIEVETKGNVLTACAFLYGLAAAELQPKELDFCDPDYQVIITVRALKK